MKRKWVLLSITIILFLFMFFIAFKTLYLSPYNQADESTELSWLTEALRNLNFINEQSNFVVNPEMVITISLLMVTVFALYFTFALFLDSWFNVDEVTEEPFILDQNIYKQDNQQLSFELSKSNNLVIAIDDVSLFLNIELLTICSRQHFILLTDDIIERFQHAVELVKTAEMKSRYEQIIYELTENTQIRSKIIYYQGSDEVIQKYYLDKSYAADKFLASCISASQEDDFTIKVVSRNESIIYKAKQLGFSTYKLKSILDENKEVNVWETEENRGIVH